MQMCKQLVLHDPAPAYPGHLIHACNRALKSPCLFPRDAARESVHSDERLGAAGQTVMGSTAMAAVFASAELLDTIILSSLTRREAAQVSCCRTSLLCGAAAHAQMTL
jgi:hypothetical protein